MNKISALSAALLAAALPAAAQAQTYPAKPIRLVCSLAPGGASDVALRLLAQKLSEGGWAATVENRPGGGGAVAANSVKTAAPDGYTLFQGDIGALTVAPAMVKNIGYDAVRDFTPITNKFFFPSVLAVPVTTPADSVASLINYLRGKQAPTYASQGIGSGGHLLGSMFVNATDLKLTHIPYKGGGQAVPEVVAGRGDLIFSSYSSVRSFVQSGKLKLLAATSRERMPELPDVPTMTEAGYPSVYFDVWFGLLGPAGMPASITRALHTRVVKAMHSPDVTQKMASLGLYVKTSESPEEFGRMIQSEVQRLARIVKEAGAVAN